MRHSIFAMLGIAALCGAPQAFAQANPSADDIINSLRPTSKELTGPTRGILPAMTAPDVPAPAAAPHVHRASYGHHSAAVAAAQDHGQVKLAVDFVTGSAELTPTADRQLDVLGQALTNPALQSSRFLIEGHTDTVGSPETNRDLSDRRAHAVAAYLEQKFAVDPARLEAVGLGVSHLLVPTPDQTPEPRNRRVRIVNLSG